MFQITRKTYLAKNLKRLQKLFPLEYDFFPRTWIVPNEISDLKIHAENTRTRIKARSQKKAIKKKSSKLELEVNLSKELDESPDKIKDDESGSEEGKSPEKIEKVEKVEKPQAFLSP